MRPKTRLGPQLHLLAYTRLVQGPALSFLCREVREKYQVIFSIFFCLSPCTKQDGDHSLSSQTRETGVSLGWGFATVCLPITSPHHCSHRLSRQPALQPKTHHPFLLHLMASLYTYRPQTFGLVFVIASVPSGKTKHTSPEYLYKAEVLNVTCDSLVGIKGRGWCCSQAARGISQALHPSRSGHWRTIHRNSVRKPETQQPSKLSALYYTTTLLLCIFLWTLLVLE